MVETTVWQGRVERKVRRRRWVELSLKVPEVEKTQTLMVMKEEYGTSQVQHPSCLVLEALVRTTVTPDDFRGDGRTWRVDRIELLECPPVRAAIQEVLQVPSLWHTLKPYTGSDDGDGDDDDEEEEDYSKATNELIKRIILRLQRREPTQPRNRPPRIGPGLVRALEEMEQQVELVDIRTVKNQSNTDDDDKVLFEPASLGLNLPQTEDDRELVSAHHKITRKEYLESKKFPQVTWFLQRLRSFSNIRHILDVGGGRGDLAIALAIGLGPDTRVTVVDMNESSLKAGQEFAEQCGVGDRMEWIYDDFVHYTETEESTTNDVDFVVALHACGYLSDLALEYAVRQEASFVICPCCYSKMKTKNVATKLAEISEAPELSRRGMHVINSTRYWNLLAKGSYQILLEEYSRDWSCRNMVMVGWPLSS